MTKIDHNGTGRNLRAFAGSQYRGPELRAQKSHNLQEINFLLGLAARIYLSCFGRMLPVLANFIAHPSNQIVYCDQATSIPAQLGPARRL